MANIAIINYCNLKCPYCFANEFIEEKKQLITDEQLDNILNWLGKEKVNTIGVIGGEPTLHPNFRCILQKLKEFILGKKTNLIVFSNGILLDRYVDLFDQNCNALINVNHPDTIGNENWVKIISTLDTFKEKDRLKYTTIGINLYKDLPDFEYIINLAKKYGYKTIRCSSVAPTCGYKGADKDAYYLHAKDTFLNFVKECNKEDVSIVLDCNIVPECYFTDSEMELLYNVTGWKNICKPVIDITPDMYGSACFGAYDLVDLAQFNDIKEAEAYFLAEKIIPKRKLNNGGKCSNCQKLDNMSCQGGCLAFTHK